MKENTGTIIAMLEELLTVSKSRQTPKSGSTNMDITSIKVLIEEAGYRTHERTEAELTKFTHGIVDYLNAILTDIVLLMALLVSALYFERSQNCDRTDNDLKFRYIRMKGETSPESIVGLENLFELNRGNGKIKQICKDVETYEETVCRQAVLIEQARLKEQAAREQENRVDSIRNKPSKSR